MEKTVYYMQTSYVKLDRHEFQVSISWIIQTMIAQG